MPSQKTAYLTAYHKLNPEQKQAVDTTDGPVLVIAGPGTGKTQLLSTRVGHILATTDAIAQNILCLTFTESGAATMRERLTKLIGHAAQDVTVSTYHAFGSELIQRYPELINVYDEFKPADDLIIDKLVREVIAGLDYSNPLKSDYFVGGIKGLISDYKRALITPEILTQICMDNLTFIDSVNKLISQYLQPNFKSSKDAWPILNDLLTASANLPDQVPTGIVPLKTLWLEALTQALEDAEATQKTQPVTKWKSDWLIKNQVGDFTVTGLKETNRQLAMIEIYDTYLKRMRHYGLYDYDDMILFAIKGLETNPDVKLTLQERYQYIMLDEFQDTNEAQLKLVELLADNPINEARPNIMAVGDDDQAIYSFQGAHYAHMERFYENYRDVLVVNLKRNYRSTKGIVSLSTNLRNQIQQRLALTDKQLVSESPATQEVVERVELPLEVEHLAWIANKIQRLLGEGHKASDIAVLAPRHKYLEKLVPYLNELNIAVRYDKRDNILDNENVIEILDAARLVLALCDPKQTALANVYWPRVLSQSHWQLPASLIWQLSWLASDNRTPWTDAVLNHPDTRPIGLFFIRLAQLAPTTTFDVILSYLLGNQALAIHEANLASYKSPYYVTHFEGIKQRADTIDIQAWSLIGQLTVLIEHIHKSSDGRITLQDMIRYIDDYTKAELHMLDTAPFQQSNDAVNLMTAYAAKGMEFKTVFMINLLDDAWGSASNQKGNSISLPPNLKHVRNDHKDDDNHLRLLFVAVSRAKQYLYMVSYAEEINNKAAPKLKFLSEHSNDDEVLISPLLPSASTVIKTPSAPQLDTKLIIPALLNFHLNKLVPDQKAILKNRLDNFSLSFTQFYSYLDVSSGGPAQFYLDHIIKFPSISSDQAKYGTAVHATLNWQFNQEKQTHKRPQIKDILAEFKNQLQKQNLDPMSFEQLLKRGEHSLSLYFKQNPAVVGLQDLSEEKFVLTLDDMRLNGKIDRIQIDEQTKTIKIIDFKTSQHQAKNFTESDMRMRKNKRQLYFYKLLIDASARFKDYRVTHGGIEFIEPDLNDGIFNKPGLEFNDQEMKQTKALVKSVWQRIMGLDFPNTSTYPETAAGIRQFEADIMANQARD